ncbi:hypothetical protein IWQ49_006364 [Labrenzia sp. EL_126]|nr:hypothetical protein [Labrenzia sp. EL_126]
MINPGGSQGDQLKIAFTISKSVSSNANTADITLYNLAEATRSGVGKEFDSITLEAGYMPLDEAGNVGVIFKGAIRDVEHRREGPDILTIISCGDGDTALRRATISKSFPAGTPVTDVIDEISKELQAEGITKGEFKYPESLETKTFKRPYAACGSCMKELDLIGRGNDFYWSVQNETLELVPGDGFIGSVALITPDTGMIGTPAITDNGVRVSALLNPEIRPNRRVQIKSDTLEMNGDDGMYRVSSVTYSGNNWDGDFKVDISGEAVKGGRVDEGIKN